MNDDLISRSALQAVFENECMGLCDCCRHIKHNPEGCALIDNAPNVDVEPVRHGSWVWNNDAIDWNIGAWVCSKCGGRNENIHADAPGKRITLSCNPYGWAGSKYCPNCGARMDGGVGE